MKIFSAILLATFGLLWCGAVTALDTKSVFDLTHQFNSRNFPSVTGEVTHSEVTTRRGSKGGVTYGVRISYQFTIDDKLFAAGKYRYNSGVSSSSGRWARSTVAKHPIGSPIAVFYDPANPSDALLSPGIGGEDLLTLLFMTPFNLIALAVCWLPLTAARQKFFARPAGGVRMLQDPPRVRLRLPTYSPWIALPLVFGLCFVEMIVVGLISDGHPSMLFISCVWVLILGIGAVVFAWRWNRIRSGIEDLVIDESNGAINLPLTCGRKNQVTVQSGEVEAVTVEKILRRRNRGRSTYWFCPTMQLRPNGNGARLAQWSSETRAEAFVDWLRERLGL